MGEAHALTGEQALDPVGDPHAVPFRACEFAMHLASIFLLRRWDLDDAPDPPLPGVVAEQHGQELAPVQVVRLRAAHPSIDFDAGRIHHDIHNGQVCERPMEPEALAARLVAAVHQRVVRQREAAPCLGNLTPEAQKITGGNGALAWRLTEARGKTELPLVLAEFEDEV